MTVEPLVYGWFVAALLVEWLSAGDPYLATMTAHPFRELGVPVGCHWEHPGRHLVHYPNGAVHLHNSQCVFQPPEER